MNAQTKVKVYKALFRYSSKAEKQCVISVRSWHIEKKNSSKSVVKITFNYNYCSLYTLGTGLIMSSYHINRYSKQLG